METTVTQQRDILRMIKSELKNDVGIKSIAALVKGYGSPDNVTIVDNKVIVRVSHSYTYLTAKNGY